LPVGELLSSHVVLKVLVISNHLNTLWVPLKLSTPVFKSFDNSKKLFVVDLVVTLG
jgi:hypothetical protein